MKNNITRDLCRSAMNPRFWLCLPWYAVALPMCFVIYVIYLLSQFMIRTGQSLEMLRARFDNLCLRATFADAIVTWIRDGQKKDKS